MEKQEVERQMALIEKAEWQTAPHSLADCGLCAECEEHLAYFAARRKEVEESFANFCSRCGAEMDENNSCPACGGQWE